MSEIPPQEPTPNAPPPADPHSLGTTSIGMSPTAAAALSYVFGWISGLIIFVVEKQSRFVRFHAMQSILLNIASIALWFLFSMMLFPMVFAGGGGLLIALVWLIQIALFVVWLICIINAAQGKWFKLPVIGDIAEKQSTPTA